jgi:hypothetical protein
VSFFFASYTVLLDHRQPGMKGRPPAIAGELSPIGGHRNGCLTRESSRGAGSRLDEDRYRPVHTPANARSEGGLLSL